MHDPFHRLYAHMAWADRQILSVLDANDSRMEESIEVFGHVVAAEAIWLSRILERDTNGLAPWTPLPLPKAAEMAASNAAAYTELLAGAPEADRIVSYRTSKGDTMESPLGDILLQVALHGTYHRGQIATRLRRHDIPVPPTDFIVFSRLGSPGG